MSIAKAIALKATRIPFPGTAITWAGEFPWFNALCFGTETGTLWITSRTGAIGLPLQQVAESGEAINGVAFTRNAMAVSTRADITINRFIDTFESKRDVIVDQTGAFDLIAAGQDRLIAPRGFDGFLLAEVSDNGLLDRRELKPHGQELFFYRLAHLGAAPQGGELLAGAGRADGIIRIALGPGNEGCIAISRGVSSVDQESIDVINICPMRTPTQPFGVAALGIDASITLVADIRQDRPITLRFPAVQGTGYSIHSVKGHILILTSEGLYVFPQLVTRFMGGHDLYGISMVSHLGVEASACYTAYDEDVFLLGTESALMFRISNLFTCTESIPQRPGERNGVTSELGSIEMAPDNVAAPWDASAEYSLEAHPLQ